MASKKLTRDELEDELLLILHHVDDVEEGIKDGDLQYARKGLADIKESLDRLKVFLPEEMQDEFSRISSVSRKISSRLQHSGLWCGGGVE